jgi:hypothetical protein
MPLPLDSHFYLDPEAAAALWDGAAAKAAKLTASGAIALVARCGALDDLPAGREAEAQELASLLPYCRLPPPPSPVGGDSSWGDPGADPAAKTAVLLQAAVMGRRPLASPALAADAACAAQNGARVLRALYEVATARGRGEAAQEVSAAVPFTSSAVWLFYREKRIPMISFDTLTLYSTKTSTPLQNSFSL